jgi:hypothetical protein
MSKSETTYDYIAVYVDDLAISMKKPKEFVDILEQRNKFKIKGNGPITIELGMDFFRDDYNTL